MGIHQTDQQYVEQGKSEGDALKKPGEGGRAKKVDNYLDAQLSETIAAAQAPKPTKERNDHSKGNLQIQEENEASWQERKT